jgi:hypothetical protein
VLRDKKVVGVFVRFRAPLQQVPHIKMKMEFWLSILKTTSKSTLTAKPYQRTSTNSDAGDNELMIAPSAYQILTLTTVLYRKTTVNGLKFSNIQTI